MSKKNNVHILILKYCTGERFKIEDIHVYFWLSDIVVGQKLIWLCKVIILQIKSKIKTEKKDTVLLKKNANHHLSFQLYTKDHWLQTITNNNEKVWNTVRITEM